MSARTVLAHLSDLETAPSLLSAALSMARASNGHILGLVVLPPVIVLTSGTPGQPDPIIIDTQRRYAQQLAEQMKERLAATLAQSGCTGEIVVADAADSTPAQVLLDHAVAADFVVVRHAAEGWVRFETADAPDSVALACGRPVVVIPDEFTGAHFARRALIAWDGSREAARALFDALPLLMAAAAVQFEWVAPEDDPYLAFGLQPADVAAMLARHGITCELKSVQRPRGLTGQTILQAAAEFQADLLVMGCYGHSRLLEFVLGGVSRHVLEHATIPVLLSH